MTTDLVRQQEIAYWRPMALFNVYRLAVAVVFILSFSFLDHKSWSQDLDDPLFIRYALAYFGSALLFSLPIALKKPRFNVQLTCQVLADIAFITVLTYASGGMKSGLGILLVIAITAASLISRGKLALFYASMATIALLLEQSYQLLKGQADISDYSQAGMLCMSCFATAWLAHTLARYSKESESLASQRGIDLENLGQVNALITQEMHDGVLVVDENFKVRHHNQQAIDLFGIEQETPPSTLAEYSNELTGIMQRWVSEGSEHGAGSFKLYKNAKELRLRFMPLGADRRHGAVIFIEDWSQIQAQAHQLKLAALGRLTANIAHEIRNPLSAISHANQLLQEDTQDPGMQRMLKIIEDNAKRMEQMVSEVLELNRRDRTLQQPLQIDLFLRTFHEQFCQVEKIPESGFLLDIQTPEAIIVFDHRHLNQILWNICRNGWRHSQQQDGSVVLSVVPKGKNIRIALKDDGPGIPPEVMAHLFEPFYTTEASGTGLGLYIARELCNANGTRLECSSNSNGSIFSMTIKHG